MTVSSETNKKTHAGNGSTVVFTTAFTFASDSEVTVTLVNNTTGVETSWTDGNQYTLTGAATGIAGSLTVDTSPTDYTPASGETLVIELLPAFTQPTALPRGGTVSPKGVLEPMHDKRVRQLLRLKDVGDRSLKIPLVEGAVGDVPQVSLRKGYVLAFHATTGAPIVSTKTLVNLESEADNAATSATAAATSATASATSATAAATSATNAATSATSSATSATAAAASYDTFDDRYLGAKSSAPSVDNDGNALLDGALYFNTTTPDTWVYDQTNTTWLTVSNSTTATAAATSATAAATSATAAATSATAAATSATNAATSATSSATSATSSATSATAAATSATNAATSATNAATSATGAATSATGAATSATGAATSATNAATSATAASDAAAAVASAYTFSTTTTMADPGAGLVRYNHATPASVTLIALDDQTAAAGNPDINAFITTWDDSTSTIKGTIKIVEVGTPANFAMYDLTGLTDNSGWFQLAVTHVTSNGTFSNTDNLRVAFAASGDKGEAGVGSGTVTSIAAGAGFSFSTITSTGTIAVDGVLQDLDTLGPVSSDGEILVGTGSGAFAWESGTTARESLGAVGIGLTLALGG